MLMLWLKTKSLLLSAFSLLLYKLNRMNLPMLHIASPPKTKIPAFLSKKCRDAKTNKTIAWYHPSFKSCCQQTFLVVPLTGEVRSGLLKTCGASFFGQRH